MVGNRRKVYIESLIHISLNLNPLGFCILFIALSQRHGILIRVCRIFLFLRKAGYFLRKAGCFLQKAGCFCEKV